MRAGKVNYFVKIIYDNEGLELPMCGGKLLCPLETFSEYFYSNLIADNDFIANYCDS